MWRQFSPLISSVKKDRQDLVKLLIEKGKFDVNSRCNDPNNWTALSVAIANNNHDMAQFLVSSMGAGSFNLLSLLFQTANKAKW